MVVPAPSAARTAYVTRADRPRGSPVALGEVTESARAGHMNRFAAVGETVRAGAPNGAALLGKRMTPIARIDWRDRSRHSPRSPEPGAPIVESDRADHLNRSARRVQVFVQVTVTGRVGHKTRKISRSRKWLVVSLLDAAQTAFVTSLASDRDFPDC